MDFLAFSVNKYSIGTQSQFIFVIEERQVRWFDLLQEYDFDVTHIPGVQNVLPDSLSRRADQALQLKFIKLEDLKFKNRITNGYSKDEWALKTIDILKENFSDDKPKDSES